MSVMIERVAMALYDYANSQEPEPDTSFEYERDYWIKLATIGIQAMREPAIAMYDFGTDKMWKDRNSTEVWQAMIDGALS